MSKSDSGLFSGTTGGELQYLNKLFSYTAYETTAIVWNHIKATQGTYRGTVIPKSFEVDVPHTTMTPAGKMWTHGNATEHMYEAMVSIKDDPRIKGSNPNLYSQFILYDYYRALGKAVSKGVNYKNIITVGNWEFAFSPARNGQKYPVVKHALFTGLKR